jgi:hypothetical protein
MAWFLNKDSHNIAVYFAQCAGRSELYYIQQGTTKHNVGHIRNKGNVK